MRVMTELRKQMQDRSVEELIDLLCEPDEGLRLSRMVDLSSMPEARLLETVYARDITVQAKLARRLIAPMVLERIGPAQFLDDGRILRAVDSQGMLPRVSYLYRQMIEMTETMGKFASFNGPLRPAKRLLAFGLGGSAIGALLAREIIQNQGYCVPLDIHMSYPETFHGIDGDTLVILCSYSGNTEEVLYAFDYAAKRTKNILIISRGGKLGRLREEYPFIEIPESDIRAPRESIGYWLTAFWTIVSWLGLARREDGAVYSFDVSDVVGVASQLDQVDDVCAGQIPFGENPAKQYATYFLYGTCSGEPSSQTDWQRPREPVVFLDGADRAIGKRLANQFGESVEHPIILLVFAEDAHNEIESVATFMLEDELYRKEGRRSYILISSRAYEAPGLSHDESRAARRIELTLKTLLKEHNVGFLTVETEGDSSLGRKLCLLKLLDYTRFYASVLFGTNPLPTIFMDMMKRKAAESAELTIERYEDWR